MGKCDHQILQVIISLVCQLVIQKGVVYGTIIFVSPFYPEPNLHRRSAIITHLAPKEPQLTRHSKTVMNMTDILETEENPEQAAQRARLHSIPSSVPPTEVTTYRTTAADMATSRETSQGPKAGIRPRLRLNPPIRRQPTEPITSCITTTSSGTSGKALPQSSEFKIRCRLRAPSPKRLRLRGPRRPVRINTRFKIPGSNSKMYVCGSKRYECPEGIRPWLSRHKWMLDPSRGVFKRFASRTQMEDDTHYYVPEIAITDGSDVEASL